jgi:hypothetical protein
MVRVQSYASSSASVPLKAQPTDASVNNATATANSPRKVSTRVNKPVKGIAMTSATSVTL